MSINSNDTIYEIGGFHKTSAQSLFSPKIKLDHLDIYNVRISPQKISFMGAYDGKKFKEKVTVRNFGKKNVVIRFGTPTSFAFQIHGNRGKTILAPGLSVTRSISYTCKITQSILKTQFPIHIDNYVYNYVIDVRFFRFLATPCIITDPPTIDFGIMNVGQSPVIRELIIQNIGDKTTTFKIDYATSDVNMVMNPHYGELCAKTSLKMSLSLIHAPIGYHIQEFWIKCDPKPIRVTIEVVVIHKQLSIIHENSSPDLTLINFPMTFRGCERYNTFLLKNSSATPTCFVILAEHKSSLYSLEVIDEKNLDTENFEIKPTSGMLCPFEERIILLSYTPQKTLPKIDWQKHIPIESQHSIFLRLMNVQDNLDKDTKQSGGLLAWNKSSTHLLSMKSIRSSTSMLSLTHSEKEYNFDIIHSYEEPGKAKKLRLCLHGVSESVQLVIEPNEIYLNVLKTIEPIKRVICLKNKSKFQEILFLYIKHPYVFVNPTTGVLKPNKSIDIEVILTPKIAGIFETAIEFEVKGMTATKSEKNYNWITLDKFQCTLKYTISSDIYKKEHKPMFNPGLVPKNTVHTVGRNVFNGITFTSTVAKPKCALYGIKKCPTHKKSKVDHCLIAFPNDVLPGSTSSNQVSKYRTIFAGLPRNTTLNQTSKRDQYSKQYESYYDRFIRKNSNNVYLNCNSKGILNVYPNSCRQCNITASDLNIFDDLKRYSVPSSLNKLTTIDDRDISNYFPRSCTYFPLTPVQLFNIQVKPHRIIFKKVSSDLAANEQIQIVNYNSFRIKLELKSTHPEINFPIGSTAFVSSQSQTGLLIRFQSKVLGKVHLIINYIINDSHSFDIDIFTEVTEKHLTIKNKLIEFNRNNIDAIFDKKSLPIEIVNSINCFTKFKFIVSNKLQYQVIPSTGLVPPLSTIICHLYRKLENYSKSQTEITMVSESGRYESLIIKCDSIIPSINLISSIIDVGILPLNILKIHHALLSNPSQVEVSYSVLNPNPIVGASIENSSGILYPKSITRLYINLKIEAIISFDFVVSIQIQNAYTIYLHVRGKVVFPQIKLKPNKIKLRRISADSFDRTAFIIQNLGETEAIINIPLTTYNQFFLSVSPDTIISPYTNDEDIYLLPNTHIKIYIHFYPTDVASYEFFLPVIINHILGPVILENESETINPKHHMLLSESQYCDNNCCNMDSTNIPDELSILRITVTVQSHVLYISKLNVNFYYSPFTIHKNVTFYNIIIKNVSTDTKSFLLRIDTLQNTPYIVQASGKHIEQTDVALIQNTYLPRDEVKLNIWFSPLQPGRYIVKLPIYVQHYGANDRVYNYITLDGIYPESNITTNIDKIYFGPIPLNITNERLIHIKAENYYVTSTISTKSTSQYITITIPEGDKVKNNDDQPIILPIIIAFKSSVPVSLYETITISDRFGNECKIDVYACADNSIITTHEFLAMYREFIQYEPNINNDKTNKINLDQAPNLVIKKTSLKIYSNIIHFNKDDCVDICIDYPKYPDSSEKSTDISNYLNAVVSKVEMFVFERMFRYEYFATIPDGILGLMDITCGGQNSNDCKYFQIHTLLTRLYGEDATRFFSKGPFPTNKIERVRFVYILLKQILDFVESQGGHIKHIDPKFLLSYEDYEIFVNVILPRTNQYKSSNKNKYLSDRKTFYQYCKRFWLDLILQSIKGKLLYINVQSLANHAKIINELKTNFPNNQNNSHKMSNINWILSHDSLQNLNPFESNVYSIHERILLAWLNHHFECHRHSIWRNGQCVPTRNICNFDTDLSDALPFIFITISYCPYLRKQCFIDLFPHATTPEMAHHNAACLVKAWQDISLGITVTPKDIVENNSVLMLLLVMFLYFSLPDYLPCELIHFKTNLSEITVRCIKISTPIDTNYIARFIGNEHQCFYTNQDNNIITVTDKGLLLRLFYHAKQIAHVTATLVLVGEVSQGIFSSSLVITLEGEPWLKPCQSINVTAPLYDNIEQVVQIKVPYTCYGDFSIFIKDDEICNLEKFTAYPWKKELHRKIPRNLYVKEKTLTYSNGKSAKLHLYLSFLLAETSNHYLVFINKQIGDFIICITMTPAQLKQKFEYTYKIPESCCSRKCICKKPTKTEFEHCPCVIYVPISKRNKYWWECFRKSQRQALSPEEWSFWDKRLDTNIGERLVQWLINEISPQKLKIYKVRETYKIENLDTSVGKILHPEKLCIEDMNVDGVVNLPILSHQPGKYILQLKSSDGLEIRCIVITLHS